MPHEVDGQVHWHEPAGLSAAGVSRYLRPALEYDRFMEQEGVPVLRASAVARLRDVLLSDWRRLGGRGCFLQLFGTEGGLGTSLLEVPASRGSRAEKHLFEEVMLVLEGRGTTEIWLEGDSERVTFEWQAGSMFSIPMNALHRIVNATAAPALLLSGTNAPAALNQICDVDAVFTNAFAFRRRFDEETGQAFDDVEPDPVRGLALCRTSLVPDVIGCDLPLDNRHSPGYRQLELAMTGPAFNCVIGEHRPGRYSKARLLPPYTVSICLRGSGFSYLWPEAAGTAPWREGRSDAVLRIEHEQIGMMGAGPGGGRWFCQTFTTSPGPLRHAVWSLPDRPSGPPGEEMRDPVSTDFAEGGYVIPYAAEDPHVRAVYAAEIARAGLVNRMRDDDYAA